MSVWLYTSEQIERYLHAFFQWPLASGKMHSLSWINGLQSLAQSLLVSRSLVSTSILLSVSVRCEQDAASSIIQVVSCRIDWLFCFKRSLGIHTRFFVGSHYSKTAKASYNDQELRINQICSDPEPFTNREYHICICKAPNVPKRSFMQSILLDNKQFDRFS